MKKTKKTKKQNKDYFEGYKDGYDMAKFETKANKEMFDDIDESVEQYHKNQKWNMSGWEMMCNGLDTFWRVSLVTVLLLLGLYVTIIR